MQYSDFILAGVIVAAHGIKGDIKIKSFLSQPESLSNFCKIYIQDGSLLPALKILATNKDMLIASLAHTCTRTQAEQLKGTELFLDKKDLPPLAQDTFYESDLIGLEVRLENDAVVGHILAVVNYGAGPLLEVQPIHHGQSVLMPFKDMFVPIVDLEKSFVQITDTFAKELEGDSA